MVAGQEDDILRGNGVIIPSLRDLEDFKQNLASLHCNSPCYATDRPEPNVKAGPTNLRLWVAPMTSPNPDWAYINNFQSVR